MNDSSLNEQSAGHTARCDLNSVGTLIALNSISAMNRNAVETPGRIRVVVATTVMLSFISFWRAAAVVLNDLGPSAFYAGGIAAQAVGKAAPWFIFGVMLFSYCVRVVYIESSSMFTRGGVYRVVKEAMGGTLAKLSVSALMFDDERSNTGAPVRLLLEAAAGKAAPANRVRNHRA